MKCLLTGGHRSINLSELELVGFCAGLGLNRSIKYFEPRLDFGGERLNHLVPFLVHNPRIRVLDLSYGNLDATAIDLLSDALLGRSEHTLQCLSLSNNPIGDANMDVLVLENTILLKEEQPNAREIDAEAYLAEFALD